ncbi:hypothetical protein KID03_10155 [bacterium]|nr:hypothetical protein [bacterium]
MKTKKISWQAIAIVVLALVLIASIALGVSGAWFQDKDSVSQTSTMGAPVQIRLAKTENDLTYNGAEKVETWANKYKTSTQVYPGDTIIGATSIINATDTPMVVRMTLKVEVTEAEGYDKNQTTKPEPVVEKPTWNSANYDEELTAYQTYANKLNSYYLNNLITTGMAEASKTEGGLWTASEDGKYYYYNQIVKAANTPIKIFDELKLDTGLTNECTGWKINVELVAEAIQAANLVTFNGAEAVVGNDDWYSTASTGKTMPATLKGLVDAYNKNGPDGRLN